MKSEPDKDEHEKQQSKKNNLRWREGKKKDHKRKI